MELTSEFQKRGMKRKHAESEEKFHMGDHVSRLLQEPEPLSQINPVKKFCNDIKTASIRTTITQAEKAKKKIACFRQRYGTLKSFENRYEMLELLGEGSFGQVVKCLKIGTNEENVAVKICRNGAVSSRYFNNECGILRQINNNNPDKFNFIRSFEFFEHQRRFCLVFEMLEQTLTNYIKDNGCKPVPLEGIRSISEQVLTAMSKLKALNIIHADLKPGNIMFVDHKKQPFKIKIIDFGEAIRLPTLNYPKILQSLLYRSPEVLLRLSYSESIDMWSFGCVLAEMLLGRYLYPGKCEYDQIRYICQTQGLPPKKMLHLSSAALEFFCLEKRKSSSGSTLHEWRLKTLEEYKRRADEPEPRKIYNSGLKNLNDITEKYRCYALKNTPRIAEVCVTQCVDLLKKTLAIMPEDRISPEDALKHIFIRPAVLPTDNSSNDKCHTLPKTCE